MSPGELLAVGRVGRAHGVRGEVSVQPLTEVSSRFDPGSVVRLGPEAERELVVRAVRRHHARLLVSFEGVDDRTAAETLRGALLLVEPGTSPPPPQDAFWVHQVVGLEVVTEEGRALGRVREVLHSAANDVWVVDTAEGEALIPALKDVVAAVDVEGGRAVVREIPGLLEDR